MTAMDVDFEAQYGEAIELAEEKRKLDTAKKTGWDKKYLDGLQLKIEDKLFKLKFDKAFNTVPEYYQ